MIETTNQNLKWLVDLHASDANSSMGTMLREHGLCTFNKLLTPEELVELAKKIGTIVYHPDADEQGIMRIWPDEAHVDVASAVGGAFTREALPLHSDGKGVTECSATLRDGTVRHGPADFFVFQAILVEDSTSAIPVFCDGHALYEKIKTAEPALFEFLTSDKAITRYTTQPDYTYSGPLFEQTRDGIAVRFNINESRDWPEGYLGKFLDISRELSFEIPLQSHQGYIIDNRRMLHGRSEIRGMSDRQAMHILAYTDKKAAIGQYLPSYSL